MIRESLDGHPDDYIFTGCERQATKFNIRFQKMDGGTWQWGNAGHINSTTSMIYFRIKRDSSGEYTVYRPDRSKNPVNVHFTDSGIMTGTVYIGFATTSGNIISGNSTKAEFEIINFNINDKTVERTEIKVEDNVTMSIDDAIILRDKLTGSGSLILTGYDGSQDLSSITNTFFHCFIKPRKLSTN